MGPKEAAKLIEKRLALELPGLEAEARLAFDQVERLKAELQAAEKVMMTKQAASTLKRERKSAAAALVKVIDLELLDVLLRKRQPTEQEYKTLEKRGLVYEYCGPYGKSKHFPWNLTTKGDQVVSMYRELTIG